MNKTGTALLIKFLMTLVFAGLTLAFLNGNAWSWVFLVGLAGTILNYLVGDLLVLPTFGNLVASLGDGVMAALTAYIVDLLVPAFTTSFTALAAFAVLVAIGEYFFHQYLLRSKEVAP